MAKLSQENLDFLLKHKIPLEDVFDATGLRRKEYAKIMEEKGYRLAYGVTPCQEFGHTLRFKKGHCAICNPMSLSYSKRFREEGYVYIVISSSTKLIKIGSSKDYKNRNENLNAEKYGGIDDWQLLAYSFQKQRALVENAIQSHFINYQVQREYFKGGQKVTTREIFDIDLKILLDTIKKLGYLFEFPNQILMKKFLANDKTTNNITTAEQLIQEQKRLAEEKARAEKLVQEQKRLAEEKAQAEKLAQEQKRLAEEKAKDEKTFQKQKNPFHIERINTGILEERLARKQAQEEAELQIKQAKLKKERARKKAENRQLAIEAQRERQRQAIQQRLAEEKAKAEKFAQEQKRLAEEQAQAEKLAQEQKRLAEEKARAEKLAQEQQQKALEWEKIILAEKLEKQKMIDSWEKSKQTYQDSEDEIEEYSSILEYLKEIVIGLFKMVFSTIGKGLIIFFALLYVLLIIGNIVAVPYIIIIFVKEVFTSIMEFFLN